MNVSDWAVPPKTAHVFMLKLEEPDSVQDFWAWAKTCMKGKIHMVDANKGWTLLNSPELPRKDYTCPFHGSHYQNVEDNHCPLTMVLVEDSEDAMLMQLRWK